jgi:hypothetical protein
LKSPLYAIDLFLKVSFGMHHLDLIRRADDDWLAIVDGYTPGAFHKAR